MNKSPNLILHDEAEGMSSELKLILEIEKYPCLYNFTLPEYSRKEVIRKAWLEIAAKSNTSIHDVKEKWRNIRSSFLRSLKAPAIGSKPKKPYYLKRHLHFILPYVKPMKNTGLKPSADHSLYMEAETETLASEPEDPLNDYSQVVIKLENLEPRLSSEIILPDEGEESSTTTSLYTNTELGQEESLNRHTTPIRRRKRRANAGEKSFKDLKCKIRRIEAGVSALQSGARSEQVTSLFGGRNGMHYFFMSLLPEFQTMTEEQIRSFKIKVMMLIDEMKCASKQQSLRAESHHVFNQASSTRHASSPSPISPQPMFSE